MPRFKIKTKNAKGLQTIVTVVQEENPDSFKVLENIVTKRVARTIAIDKTTNHLYLRTAEFEAPKEGA